MKSLVSKTWQRIVALFLTVVAVFGVFGFSPVSRKVSAEAGEYALVTDASTLAAGNKVIIADSSANYALSTNQKTSNRAGVAIEAVDGKVTPNNDVQILTLEKDEGTGFFSFNTGSGYLYASSSSNNQLKTQDTLNKNGKWVITITDRVASIIAQGSNSRNVMQYNPNNGSPIFACYASASQTAICLYKLVETTSGGEDSGSGETPDVPETPSCEHTNKEAIGENKDATCTEAGSKAGLKCADCDFVIEAQEIIPATGHSYVDGVCSVCNAEQPTMLTITKAKFGTVSSYGWHGWTAQTTTGEDISGFGYITKNDNIQVNGGQSGDYIYNTTALPGKITSVKLTQASGTARNFGVLTSETAYNYETTASLKGQVEEEAKKIVTTEGVTWEFTTNHKYFAIVITDKNAAYLSSIEIEYYVCPHTNTTAIGENKDATCTEEGSKAGEKCVDCGEIVAEIKIIPAAGHTDVNPADSKCDTCGANLCTEHSWEDGEVITKPTCTETGLQTQVCKNCGELGEDKVLDALGHTTVIDEAVAPTCTASGLTEGSHCSVCKEVLVAQEEVDALGHNYVEGICVNCKDELVFFQKVTDVSELAIGDSIIIAAADAAAALGEQEKNYRTQAEVEKAGNVLFFGGESKAQILTLASGTKDGAFAFKTGAGYLYAASGSNNYLKTETALSDNSSWTIEIADGVATIKAQGENTHNWLRYNSKDVRFSCYGETSNQKDVAIYKAVRMQTSVVLTSDLAIKFAVENMEGATVQLNGETATAIGEATISGKAYNVYEYKNIKPENIADDVVLTVYNGENVLIGRLAYSVKDYCDQVIGGAVKDAAFVDVCKALLHYGAEAQKLAGKTDLANKDLDPLGDVAMDRNDYIVEPGEDAVVRIEKTAVTLDNSITVKYQLDGWTEGMSVKMSLGDEDVSADVTVVAGENGQYIASYTFKTAKDFGKVFTFEVVEGDASKSDIVNNSVRSYCYSLANDETYGEQWDALAQAIYHYVDAIDAYVGA